MNFRKNVKDLSSAERAVFVQAVLDLKNNAPSRITAAQMDGAQGRYDDYVWVHNRARLDAPLGAVFMPWLREFLYQFEWDLQQVSGDRNLRIPYWDWTTAQAPDDPGWPFTDDFMGGLGASNTDSRVTTGPFATNPFDPNSSQWVINVWHLETNNYLRREGNLQGFSSPTSVYTQISIGNGNGQASRCSQCDPTPLITPEFSLSASQFLKSIFYESLHHWVGRPLMSLSDRKVCDRDMLESVAWEASPNDPLFFLHRCNMDRLWAIWQQRHCYRDHLRQPASAAANHRRTAKTDRSRFFIRGWSPPRTLLSQGKQDFLRSWYDSDLPCVTLATPSLNFGKVPEGQTLCKPVQFTVETSRPVYFRITTIGGPNFSVPLPGPNAVSPSQDNSPITTQIYTQYTSAPPLGLPQGGQAVIEAYIEDMEGYYVDPKEPAFPECVVGSWAVNFTALPVAQPSSAVVLVLDRSGSMKLNAGGKARRFDLLKDAVQVVADVMEEKDGLGMVYFDHKADRAFDITSMTPSSGRRAVLEALANPTLGPELGSTAIGPAIIEGAQVLTEAMTLPGTPYQHFAMVLMTDGNESVAPHVNQSEVSAAICGFADQVYAIGLGQEGEVSEAALSDITHHMLLTGRLTSQDQQFRLTKYFLQALADLKQMDRLVEVDGDLFLSAEHRIPFDVNEAERGIDVIALCPYAFLLDIALERPDGTLINSFNLGPNVSYQANAKDAFYRLRLPVLPDEPQGTQAGPWTAILTLSEEKVHQLLHQLDHLPQLLGGLEGNTLPYSLVIQSHSDIHLDVKVQQATLPAGTSLDLYAKLTQYGMPLEARADVTVEVTDPLDSVTTVRLCEYAPGNFKATHQTNVAGTYRCRFSAVGYSLGGKRFTRRQLRTTPIYARRPNASRGRDLQEECEVWCELMA